MPDAVFLEMRRITRGAGVCFDFADYSVFFEIFDCPDVFAFFAPESMVWALTEPLVIADFVDCVCAGSFL
jgi:hypothetical protein